MTLANKIEAILLFKNDPVSYKELGRALDKDVSEIKTALKELREFYKDRGITIVDEGESVAFGTSADASSLIEKMQKEELSRELGRAGLETLSIVLYKGPVSRREIDYIRGVNSGFILRNLLIRGLIERTESREGERSFSYKATIELLRYLGIGKKEDLPEYETAFAKLDEFAKNETDELQDADQ